ncbi:MAG: hypothetical protein AAF726_09745 [Planctomycetota bacterium]
MLRFPYDEDGRYEVERVHSDGTVAARTVVEVSGIELELVEGSGR